MKFSDHVKRLQREYYVGNIQRPTAIAMMDSLMRQFNMLGDDEKLVDIPDDFGRHFEQTGFLGEFTVQHERSPYKWKRSYSDRFKNADNSTVNAKVRLFTEPPPSSLHHNGSKTTNREGSFTWHGPAGNRKRVTVPQVPALSEADQKFFASYEKQMEKVEPR